MGYGSSFYAASLVVFLGMHGAHAEAGKQAVSSRELQDKIVFCKSCHGLSAEGYVGAVVIPRLAGQQPQYIENQLKALAEGRREDKIMGNVARSLRPEMIKALSEQFANLNPVPVSAVSVELVAAGKKIFEEGVPGKEIPPCTACHGDDGKGAGEFPRLAGQLNGYVVRQLSQWGSIRGLIADKPDSAAIMAPIASKLSPQQISAVAAYLNTLK